MTTRGLPKTSFFFFFFFYVENQIHASPEHFIQSNFFPTNQSYYLVRYTSPFLGSFVNAATIHLSQVIKKFGLYSTTLYLRVGLTVKIIIIKIKIKWAIFLTLFNKACSNTLLWC